ncbi:MAG: aminotransferase class III-fold pyridoxal phosphate-dependent enzyme [Woeseiaceae bacterium]|nr:aminotransferase class III-fold pyridoxal phosphate-dependent enzyme [Woeseiaceae bacterium]
MSEKELKNLDGIAIVGLACRAPGARNVDEFWANLLSERESITFFDDDQLDKSIPAAIRNDSSYVKARGIVEDADKFDALFFGISPAEATVMDPQQRQFLEVGWEALEHAGVDKDRSGLIGVYAGTGVNTYFTNNVLRRPDLVDSYGEFNVVTANDKDYVATRMSYKLDLRGPSIDIQSACSTSLVAVVHAYWSLLTYQCDVALTGGSSIDVPVNAGYIYEEGSMLSADGHCRPFDAGANGTLFNSGVCALVLKRLEDAVEDRDRIYAVIRGAAVNNDGNDKVSFSAPSVNGQADVIRQAMDQAGFSADTISYVETHGTATPLGDPIEIEALTSAFRHDTSYNQYCGIGSVKSNVGHLVAAAGAAGLIKTAMALYHRKIPASINYKSPNPSIDFENSPFKVVEETGEWLQAEGLRRAGVSSFGVGGTNAHVVLEEWPDKGSSEEPLSAQQLIPISAKSEAALKDMSEQLAAAIEKADPRDLADAAFSLQIGRSRLAERRFVVGASGGEVAAALLDPKSSLGGRGKQVANDPRTAFLFPGQGSQHKKMSEGLIAANPAARAAFEDCAEIARQASGIDLTEMVFADESDDSVLQATINAQPALFAVEYAIAKGWMSLGIKPNALIGHSIGEFVAACIAGVFSLEDAVRTVAKRGELMQAMPPGSMLSVRASAAEIAGIVEEPLCIAAINAPSLCVVAGPDQDIQQFAARLEQSDIANSVLHTSHAFHSKSMEAAVKPLSEFIASLSLNRPKIPIVSTATGNWLESSTAVDPGYWGQQLRETVQFAPAIATLLQDEQWVLIEAGPRQAATQLSRQQIRATGGSHRAIPSLGTDSGVENDQTNWLKAIGEAWISGLQPSWQTLHEGSARLKTPLPTYPFEKKRFWADVGAPPSTTDMAMSPAVALDSADVPVVSESSNDQVTDEAIGIECMSETDRLSGISERIRSVLADTSGLDADQIDDSLEFVEQGFDSLFLTQAATALKKEFGQKVTFRQLMEDVSTVTLLAEYLSELLPMEDRAPPVAVAQPIADSQVTTQMLQSGGEEMKSQTQNSSVVESLVQQQLDIMRQQLAVLSGTPAVSAGVQAASAPAIPTSGTEKSGLAEESAAAPTSTGVAKAPRAGAKISRSADDLTQAQSANLQDFIRRYNAMTARSKSFAQEHRAFLADPRTASGFRPAFKEMVYQVVVERSSGSRVWDVDGNEYIDLLNGFGSNMLGHLPEYVRKALHEQTDLGLEIGPQTSLAGEVARLFCELSGTERMAFSNTGSEAVAGAVRIARTVTGRGLIVTFDGDYHGIFDEVLVRGTPSMKTLPSSPGVNRESVENMLVLPFGDDSVFDVIREHKDDVAGILVECVQGGDPGNVQTEWLKRLRDVATEIDAALICDEVITGFRVHPQGAQGYFGIDADLATYGKVVGGGLPIGIIAGKSAYMDALDGGYWEFGDDSIPEVGVTYFAGTFVRHPLTMAASRSALQYMKDSGPQLQEKLNELSDEFVGDMNEYFEQVNAPWRFENFGSLMNLKSTWDSPFQELLFYLLRYNGVHAWYGRPCFLTDSHTREDLQEVKRAFMRSIESIAEMGFLETLRIDRKVARNTEKSPVKEFSSEPPVEGARLGRDPEGNPGWFIPDPDRPGKYLQIGG